MSGMLPGVECARRRRLHHSGGGSSYLASMPNRGYTARSFCLYIRNLQNQSSFSSSSLLERNTLNVDDNLGGPAREAKRRLDERFSAHMKSENKITKRRKGLFHALWQQLRLLN